jgi:tetratricopeptide (TPR) repeat protein
VTHDSQLAHYRSLLAGLSSATQPSGLSAARQAAEAAVNASPDDPVLCAQSARLKLDAGDTTGAEADARRAVKLLPASSANWSPLGGALVAAEKFEAAAGAYQRAFELSPQNVFALQHRALALARLGRRDEAIREDERAVAIKLGYGPIWLELGTAPRSRRRQGCGGKMFSAGAGQSLSPRRQPRGVRALLQWPGPVGRCD